VLHRDLKPANILVGRDRFGEVLPKVADFGISKLTDEPVAVTVTEDGTLVGTLGYMAPEQLRTPRAIDARADQYSLAVILYQGATGHLPHMADSPLGMLEAVARGEVPPLRAIREDLPLGFEEAVLRALHVDPAARFASVRELARALLPFASGRAWSTFGRDFDESSSGADAPPAPTCDEASFPVADTGSPLTVSRGSTRQRRPIGSLGLASGLALAVAAFIAYSAFHRPLVVAGAPPPAAAVVAAPPSSVAPPASPAPAPPPTVAVVETVKAIAVSAHTSVPRVHSPADAGAASKKRYELGDHDAPILE
jgi:serine/threonine-protein kinase